MKLFDDLLDGLSRRYFGTLESAPGSISPATAIITLSGRTPIAVQPEVVFRTPATLTLTLNGLSLAAPVVLSPAPAALAYGGLLPSTTIRWLIVSPSLPQLESPEADFSPTLLLQMTVTPDTAALSWQARQQAVTQGGNIGFVFPDRALLTLTGLQQNFVFDVVGVAPLSLIGYAPEIIATELTLYPDVATLGFSQTPPALTLPFVWVDADPSPPLVWVSSAAGSS